MASLEIIIIAFFTIAMAIAALETEKPSHAIIFLALSSIGIGTIFLLVGAMYAAMFEYLIYAGVLIILFMVVASFTGKEELQESGKEASAE
ncbi:MAG: NADH-quinone oxidoreductase subunit J [Candidatus Hodarchaeales archaeon]|jgi:NADH-quinone oxidoreductase subunit J